LNDRTQRTSVKEAKRLLREVTRVVKRRGGRLTPKAKVAVDSCIADLRRALDEEVHPDRLDATSKILRAEVERNSHVLRKATAMEYVQSLGLAVGVALVIRAFIIEAFKIPTGSMIPTLMVDDHIFVNKFTYGLRIPFTHTDVVDIEEPRRGDIAVFEFPGEGEDKGKDFIKRVVAVAGDRVRLSGNRLFINGEPVVTEDLERDVPCADSTLGICRCVRQQETQGDTSYVTQHLLEDPKHGGAGCVNSPDWPSANPLQFGSRGTNGDYPEVVVPDDHVLAFGDNRDNSSDGRYWGYVPVENIKGRALFIWWPPGRWFQAVK